MTNAPEMLEFAIVMLCWNEALRNRLGIAGKVQVSVKNQVTGLGVLRSIETVVQR